MGIIVSKSAEALEYADVTDRARAAGWQLPDGWTVEVDLTRDEWVGDPSDNSDVYAHDFALNDAGETVKAFCRGCDRVIDRGRERWYAGTTVVCDGGMYPFGRWYNAPDDVTYECEACEGTGQGEPDGEGLVDNCTVCLGEGGGWAHSPAVSRVLEAWHEDQWMFVFANVYVEDAAGRQWGTAGIGGTEYGDFPVVHDDGSVETMNLNPIDPTSDYDIVREHDLIRQALEAAVTELEAFGTPVIVAPVGDTVAGL